MHMKAKQQKCLELLITGMYKDSEVAEMCGISRKTLWDWKRNDEEFKTEYERLVDNNIKYAAAKAFKKQTELLEAKDEKVAHLAAKDLLDRAGFKQKDKLELSGLEDEKSKLDNILSQMCGDD